MTIKSTVAWKSWPLQLPNDKYLIDLFRIKAVETTSKSQPAKEKERHSLLGSETNSPPKLVRAVQLEVVQVKMYTNCTSGNITLDP